MGAGGIHEHRVLLTVRALEDPGEERSLGAGIRPLRSLFTPVGQAHPLSRTPAASSSVDGVLAGAGPAPASRRPSARPGAPARGWPATPCAARARWAPASSPRRPAGRGRPSRCSRGPARTGARSPPRPLDEGGDRDRLDEDAAGHELLPALHRLSREETRSGAGAHSAGRSRPLPVPTHAETATTSRLTAISADRIRPRGSGSRARWRAPGAHGTCDGAPRHVRGPAIPAATPGLERLPTMP